MRLREGNGQQRERGGRHDRGEAALQRACTEEHGRILGESSQSGRDPETQESNNEDPSTPQVISNSSTEKKETPKHQCVGTHYPLTIGDRNVQGVLRRRKGNDDDRGVKDDHELSNGNNGEYPIALGVEAAVLGGCGVSELFGGHRTLLFSQGDLS